MSQADVLQYVSYLAGAYAIGWASGYLLLTFKKLMEKI